MPKLILSFDNIVVKKVPLTKSQSTIGRRPYNDIVIENLAVSGEHAVIQNTGNQMVLKDLGSTNGTYVNGKPIRTHVLAYGDQIEIGKCKIQYVESTDQSTPETLDKPNGGAAGTNGSNFTSPTVPSVLSITSPAALDSNAIPGPCVRVLDGPSAGKSLALTKVVSIIGNPHISVASITRRGNRYDLAHVSGEQVASVNGVPAAGGSTALRHGDRINVSGVQLEFLDH